MRDNLRMALMALVGIPAILLCATVLSVLLGLYTAPGMLLRTSLSNTSYARSVEKGYTLLSKLASKV